MLTRSHQQSSPTVQRQRPGAAAADRSSVDDVMDACASSMGSLRLLTTGASPQKVAPPAFPLQPRRTSPRKRPVAADLENFSIPSAQFYGVPSRPSVRPTGGLVRSSPAKSVSNDADAFDSDFEPEESESCGSSSLEASDSGRSTPAGPVDRPRPSNDQAMMLRELEALHRDQSAFLGEGRILHDDASDYNPSEDEMRHLDTSASLQAAGWKIGSPKWRPKLNWRANLLVAHCYRDAGTEKYETVAQLFRYNPAQRRWVNKGPVLVVLLSSAFRLVAHYLYGTHAAALNIPMWEFWSQHFCPSPFNQSRTILFNSYGNGARTQTMFVPHHVKLAATLVGPNAAACAARLDRAVLESDVVLLESVLTAEREPFASSYALRFDSETARNNMLATVNEMIVRLRRHDREKRSGSFLVPQPIAVPADLANAHQVQRLVGGEAPEFTWIMRRGFIEALAACGFIYAPTVRPALPGSAPASRLDEALARLGLRTALDNAKCVYCGVELEGFGPHMGTHCGTRQGTRFAASDAQIHPRYLDVDPEEFHMYLPQIQVAHTGRARELGLVCPYAQAIDQFLGRGSGQSLADPSLPASLQPLSSRGGSVG